ncbi:hypothetical protein HT136_01295 [Novosphingobium profundi]|uniref:hypothetical protein n=1 Tax=Novosphingobium profundi TaxID=1774954 RepID=UPI001BDAFDD6|nr:hypothetical protein [Novosphingobium profundi]MBT0667001.1 hypothetical protein [Novosphingobium profundi]
MGLIDPAADLAQAHRSTLLAASLAGDAVAELLRFHIEGPICNWPFNEEAHPVARLAEALLRTARVEASCLDIQPLAKDYCESLGQLAAACSKFLDDQANGDPLETEIEEEELPF